MNTVLVIPWGSPWKSPCVNGPELNDPSNLRWKEVNYVWLGDGGRSRVSRTPLPLLLEVFDPAHILFIVCDTVACCSDLRGDGSFERLAESVKVKYEAFIEDVLGKELFSRNKERVAVHVVPCYGSYRNGSFRVSPLDTYAWIMYGLYTKISEALAKNEEIEVVIDLTHGINYLHTLTYRAAREILHHAAFAAETRLKVVNSDPYIENVTKELRINVVEDTHIRPLTTLESVEAMMGEGGEVSVIPSFRGYTDFASAGNDSVRQARKLSEDLFGPTGKDLRKSLSDLLYFYASIHSGMPLATHHFMQPPDSIDKVINKVFSIHKREGFFTTCREGRVEVTEAVRLGPSISFVMVAGTLLKAVTAKARNAVSDPTGEGASLKQLKDIAHTSSWTEVMRTVVSDEIHRVRKDICEYILTNSLPEGEQPDADTVNKCAKALEKLEDWRHLTDLKQATNREFSERNFMAHAGLEYNVTRVKLNILLSYDKSEERRIKNTLKKSLKPDLHRKLLDA